jgi:hypothetical protein
LPLVRFSIMGTLLDWLTDPEVMNLRPFVIDVTYSPEERPTRNPSVLCE